MANPLRGMVIRILRLPPEPPAPFGEEQSLHVFRASPQFLKYKIATWCIGQAFLALLLGGGAIACLVAAIAVDEPEARILLPLAALAMVLFLIGQAAFSFMTLRLDYEMRWYKVTDRSLRIREGIWFVREMTMTFANIQNIEITQGPIQRWLGISDLKVQTAGGGGAVNVQSEGQGKQQVFNMHLGYFRGVDNAEHILKLMQERLRRQKSTGLGDHDEAPDEQDNSAKLSVSPATLEAAKSLLEEARGFRAAATQLAQH